MPNLFRLEEDGIRLYLPYQYHYIGHNVFGSNYPFVDTFGKFCSKSCETPAGQGAHWPSG